MSEYVRLCPKCRKPQNNCLAGRGYSIYLNEDEYICRDCGGQVVDLKMLSADYRVLLEISYEPDFVESMMELHDTDIVEYNLKMAQFRAMVNQQEESSSSRQAHCPHCNSTNIKSLSGVDRGVSIALWGIFSKKLNKSFECKNCGYTW